MILYILLFFSLSAQTVFDVAGTQADNLSGLDIIMNKKGSFSLEKYGKYLYDMVTASRSYPSAKQDKLAFSVSDFTGFFEKTEFSNRKKTSVFIEAHGNVESLGAIAKRGSVDYDFIDLWQDIYTRLKQKTATKRPKSLLLIFNNCHGGSAINTFVSFHFDKKLKEIGVPIEMVSFASMDKYALAHTVRLSQKFLVAFDPFSKTYLNILVNNKYEDLYKEYLFFSQIKNIKISDSVEKTVNFILDKKVERLSVNQILESIKELSINWSFNYKNQNKLIPVYDIVDQLFSELLLKIENVNVVKQFDIINDVLKSLHENNELLTLHSKHITKISQLINNNISDINMESKKHLDILRLLFVFSNYYFEQDMNTFHSRYGKDLNSLFANNISIVKSILTKEKITNKSINPLVNLYYELNKFINLTNDNNFFHNFIYESDLRDKDPQLLEVKRKYYDSLINVFKYVWKNNITERNGTSFYFGESKIKYTPFLELISSYIANSDSEKAIYHKEKLANLLKEFINNKEAKSFYQLVEKMRIIGDLTLSKNLVSLFQDDLKKYMQEDLFNDYTNISMLKETFIAENKAKLLFVSAWEDSSNKIESNTNVLFSRLLAGSLNFAKEELIDFFVKRVSFVLKSNNSEKLAVTMNSKLGIDVDIYFKLLNRTIKEVLETLEIENIKLNNKKVVFDYFESMFDLIVYDERVGDIIVSTNRKNEYDALLNTYFSLRIKNENEQFWLPDKQVEILSNLNKLDYIKKYQLNMVEALSSLDTEEAFFLQIIILLAEMKEQNCELVNSILTEAVKRNFDVFVIKLLYVQDIYKDENKDTLINTYKVINTLELEENVSIRLLSILSKYLKGSYKYQDFLNIVFYKNPIETILSFVISVSCR